MARQCDVLIVGAGLAGLLLGHQLKQAGKSIIIISDPNLPSASRVAAGLINPVTGKRLVLQEHIDTLLPFAIEYYQQLEARFDTHFLTPKPMLRIMSSKNERETWSKRCSNKDYSPFLGTEVAEKSIKCQFTAFSQHQTSILDTNALLDTLQTHFKHHDQLIETNLNYNDIKLLPQSVIWQGIRATTMIFCEGWRGQHNPWFQGLPFQAAKGEILTLKSNEPLTDKILNWGKWLLPLGDNTFKLGASYDRHSVDEHTTKTAKEQLIESLSSLLNHPINLTITRHQAGIRPGTQDRQPFMGRHTKHPSLGIFNGFGSKGSLLIPWFAHQWVQHLCHDMTFPTSADIARYDKA